MPAGFIELTLVIVVATVLGILARLARQPTVLAYLFAGVLIGYFNFFNVADRETFQVFADLGIMFLLFLVGLEVNYRSLKLVGWGSAMIGLIQIVVSVAAGYILARFFGYSPLVSSYIAAAVSFSSTIITVKILSDKGDLNSLYGKIAIGVLLFQDVCAVLILVVLTGFAPLVLEGAGSGFGLATKVAQTLIGGILLFVVAFYASKNVVPRFFQFIARSPELLFLASLAWVFLFASITGLLGFPVAIGGLLAGITLANSYEHFQIANRVRPLRDFFLLIFFAILGSSVVLSSFTGIVGTIVVFSALVLIGKPIIVFFASSLMGYRKRPSFLSGIALGQISEFSLILAAAGYQLGHLSSDVVALITAVGIVTITVSTYIETGGESLYARLNPYISFFERGGIRDVRSESTPRGSIVLIGFHRTGRSIADALGVRSDLLVIDFDPEAVGVLKERGIAFVFGDMTDPDIIERAYLRNAKLVISTSPDIESNVMLLHALKRREGTGDLARGVPRIITRARTDHEAEALYEAGADYVLLPHAAAGEYLGHSITHDPELRFIDKARRGTGVAPAKKPNLSPRGSYF